MEYYESFAEHAFENTTQSVYSHCVLLKPSGAPIPATFCFSIRRDIYDLPSLIIGTNLTCQTNSQHRANLLVCRTMVTIAIATVFYVLIKFGPTGNMQYSYPSSSISPSKLAGLSSLVSHSVPYFFASRILTTWQHLATAFFRHSYTIKQLKHIENTLKRSPLIQAKKQESTK